MKTVESVLVVVLGLGMLFVLWRWSVRMDEAAYDRGRYKGKRPVSARRMQDIHVVDADDFWRQS